jgi:hypothetical protein
MRTQPAIAALLAAATVLAGAVALATTAEARKQPRYYQPRAYQPYYNPPPRYYRPPRAYRAPRAYSWERMVCEENAQAADPTGLYAGYPCWARETFGRTPGGRGR